MSKLPTDASPGEASSGEPSSGEASLGESSQTSSERPLVRPWIVKLLLALMVSIAGLALFWDHLAVWRSHSRAQDLFRAHRESEALQELRGALLHGSDNPATVFQLARAHRRLGSLEEALMLLDASAQLGADADRVALEKRLVALQTGQIRGFDKELPQMLMDRADDASDILQAYVLGLFANMRTEDAFVLLEGWEQSSPSDPQPKFLQAYLYQGIDRLDAATAAYRSGLKLAPDATRMRTRLAQVLLESGELDAAKVETIQCLNEAPDEIEAMFLLAQCTFALGDTSAALEELEGVIEAAPRHIDALRLRGQLQLNAGNPEAALADLEYVASQQPDDTVAREALGRALQAVGRAAEAKPHFDFVSTASKEKAETVRLIRQVMAEPGNVELRFEIGMRLLNRGSTDDGIRWLRTVLEIRPDHTATHRTMAEIFQMRGDLANAALHRQAAGL